MMLPQSREICYWLGGLRHAPTVKHIREVWHVSRATAFRWRRFKLDMMAHPLELSPTGRRRFPPERDQEQGHGC